MLHRVCAARAERNNVKKHRSLQTYTCNIIDYSKAFDSLHHEILLQKLHKYGIRGVSHALMQSYMSNREQCVVHNGYQSSFRKILCGVPQGSVLGPVLFNVYVNDVISINKQAEFMLYADDTSLFISNADATRLFSAANFTLTQLHAWSNKNCLKINAKKTKCILFAPKNKNINVTEDLILGVSQIDIVKQHKVLGMVLSHRMTWDAHVELLAKKLSCAVGALYRYRDFFPLNIKLQIYHSLFRSHLITVR